MIRFCVLYPDLTLKYFVSSDYNASTPRAVIDFSEIEHAYICLPDDGKLIIKQELNRTNPKFLTIFSTGNYYPNGVITNGIYNSRKNTFVCLFHFFGNP